MELTERRLYRRLWRRPTRYRRLNGGLIGIRATISQLVRHRVVADTYDDVADHIVPDVGTDAPMNHAHAQIRRVRKLLDPFQVIWGV